MWWHTEELFNRKKYSNRVTFTRFDNIQNQQLNSVRIDVYDDNGEIRLGFFEISEQPHCCGALFLSNMCTYVKGAKYSIKLFQTVDEFVRLGGYSMVQCIIPVPKNKDSCDWYYRKGKQRVVRLFQINGFVKSGKGIVNKRTGNVLYTYTKEYKYD